MASWPFTLLPSPFDPTKTATFTQHFGTPLVTKLDSPLDLFWKDVYNILLHLNLLPDVLRPLLPTRKTDELYPLPPQGLPLWWWILSSLLQLPVMIFLIVAGIITISALQALTKIHSLIFWSIVQGPELQVFPPDLPRDYDPSARWVFLNGIAVTGEGLHQNLRVLSHTFNAPILGVHNRTYGLLGDLVECVFQRSFGFHTLDTRIAIPILKTYLEQEGVEKVVLVAHSQGGICASQVLDSLFAEVSWDSIHAKLEVYTFGSAALHFENPVYESGGREKLVRHMEHYCHEDDIVCSWGALSSIKRRGEVYRGKVFVQKGATGHLLNQHYLKSMFPAGQEEEAEGRDRERVLGAFLEGKIVPYTGAGTESRERWYVLPDDQVTPGETRVVKDVSRLWRYMVGLEEVKLVNGAGKL